MAPCQLYTALKAAGKRVVVVDCEDLLEDPEAVLRKYCEAIGFDFKPGMSSWQPGPQPDWDAWQGWHDDALKSTGFHKPSSRKQDVLPAVSPPSPPGGWVPERPPRSGGGRRPGPARRPPHMPATLRRWFGSWRI